MCGVALKLKTVGFCTAPRSGRLHTATRSADRMLRVAEPLLAREADGRAFRLIGLGAYDLVADGRETQAELFETGPGDGGLDVVLDALRDRFGDDAIVRGQGFGVRLARQGPSQVACAAGAVTGRDPGGDVRRSAPWWTRPGS